MAYLLLFAPRVETLAGNCNMARLATTTADPVEGAVLDTVSMCAADLSLKASEANRRRAILNKRHLHIMSDVKDIREGFVMVGDDWMIFAEGAQKGTNFSVRDLAREISEED